MRPRETPFESACLQNSSESSLRVNDGIAGTPGDSSQQPFGGDVSILLPLERSVLFALAPYCARLGAVTIALHCPAISYGRQASPAWLQ